CSPRAGWRRYGAAGPPADRPSCRMPRPPSSSRCCCKGPRPTGSPPICGPWTGSPRWSSGSRGYGWPGRRPGGCWSGGWAGACSGPSARPASAMRRRSRVGWPMSGPGSKRGARKIGLASLLRRVGHLAAAGHPPNLVDRKSTRLNSSHTVIYTLSLHDALPISMSGPGSKRGARKIGLASLLRRVGHLAAAGHPPNLVAAWGDPDPAASLQLEAGLDGGRAGLSRPRPRPRPQAVLPPAEGQLQHPDADRRAGTARRLLCRPAGGAGVGWAGGALEPRHARLAGDPAALADRRAAAGLRTRAEPRRIPVGEPQGVWSWPTSPATPSLRWPTPPSRASGGSVMTSSWSGRFWPTPACPLTTNLQPTYENLK